MKLSKQNAESKYLFGLDEFKSPVQVGFVDNPEKLKHFHNEVFEYFLVCSGHIVMEVKGIEVRVSEGEALCVEPGEKHMIKESSGDFKCFIVKYPIDQKDKTIC